MGVIDPTFPGLLLDASSSSPGWSFTSLIRHPDGALTVYLIFPALLSRLLKESWVRIIIAEAFASPFQLRIATKSCQLILRKETDHSTVLLCDFYRVRNTVRKLLQP
jgi:hypothetical protein